jgi:hypothetical protein
VFVIQLFYPIALEDLMVSTYLNFKYKSFLKYFQLNQKQITIEIIVLLIACKLFVLDVSLKIASSSFSNQCTSVSIVITQKALHSV